MMAEVSPNVVSVDMGVDVMTTDYSIIQSCEIGTVSTLCTRSSSSVAILPMAHTAHFVAFQHEMEAYMHAIAPTDHRADEHVDTNPSRDGTSTSASNTRSPTQSPDHEQLPLKDGKSRRANNQAACLNCRARHRRVTATSSQASSHAKMQLINGTVQWRTVKNMKHSPIVRREL